MPKSPKKHRRKLLKQVQTRAPEPPCPPEPPAPQNFKPVIVTRSWKPLTAEQRKVIFAEWTTDDARFRALWDQLGEEFEAALMGLLNQPGDIESVMRHIGELRGIVNLKALIMSSKKGEAA